MRFISPQDPKIPLQPTNPGELRKNQHFLWQSLFYNLFPHCGLFNAVDFFEAQGQFLVVFFRASFCLDNLQYESSILIGSRRNFSYKPEC